MADKTIVVGDVHVAPKQNLKRATWLGRLIKDVKPDRVVYIGDYGTFDSLSAWDKDKRKLMEGRRFSQDVDSLRQFNRLVEKEVDSHEYETILTEGNHEYRIERYTDTHAEMDGSLDYVAQADLQGWKTIPYKSFYKHRGVGFTHVPIMENGRPVSGKYATERALDICSESVIFGHTHKLDYKAKHRHGAKHLQEALNVGCFFEHIDAYAQGSATSYWRGLIVLEHYKFGRFKFEAIPMGLLKRDYNGKN